MGVVDGGRRNLWCPHVVVGQNAATPGIRAVVRRRRHPFDARLAVLDVEAMTVAVDVPEEHPLRAYRPVRMPVWWGWRGEVGKRCTSPVHTGRLVVLRIEKQFTRFERLLAKLFRAPGEVRRPLDAMNSLIWELSDGTHDFQTIVNHLNDAYQEEATPVIERSTAAIRGFVALGVMKLVPDGADIGWSTEPGRVPEDQDLEARDPDVDQWS